MKVGACNQPPGAIGALEDSSIIRHQLEQEWLTLTRDTMPALAATRGWPMRADHCFQRILLDHATEGVWYDAITGRPAYRHATPEVLARGIALGRAVVAGDLDLAALNRQSLAWRAGE